VCFGASILRVQKERLMSSQENALSYLAGAYSIFYPSWHLLVPDVGISNVRLMDKFLVEMDTYARQKALRGLSKGFSIHLNSPRSYFSQRRDLRGVSWKPAFIRCWGWKKMERIKELCEQQGLVLGSLRSFSLAVIGGVFKERDFPLPLVVVAPSKNGPRALCLMPDMGGLSLFEGDYGAQWASDWRFFAVKPM